MPTGLRIKKDNTLRGSSLYFAILILSILLAMGLGLSALLIRQIRMISAMGDSVKAFYAADTGIEMALYEMYVSKTSPENITFNGVLLNDASYSVTGFAPAVGDPDDPNCPNPPNDYFCIKSVGTYKGTKRAIEVSY